MIDDDDADEPLTELEAFLDPDMWDRVKEAERDATFYVAAKRNRHLTRQLANLMQHVATRTDATNGATPSNRATGMALLLVGEPAAGKTTAIYRALMEIPSLRPTGGAEPTRRLVSFNAPGSAHAKALGRRFLRALGYTIKRSNLDADYVWDQVAARCKRFGVLVVHIDNAANILVSTSGNATKNASQVEAAFKYLRALMDDDEHPVSLILSGLPDLIAHPALTTRGEIGSRARTVRFDPLTDRDVSRIRKGLSKRAEAQGLVLDVSDVDDLAWRLIDASSGAFGAVFKMVDEAVAIARVRGSVTADGVVTVAMKDFIAMYYDRTGVPPDENPFVVERARRVPAATGTGGR